MKTILAWLMIPFASLASAFNIIETTIRAEMTTPAGIAIVLGTLLSLILLPILLLSEGKNISFDLVFALVFIATCAIVLKTHDREIAAKKKAAVESAHNLVTAALGIPNPTQLVEQGKAQAQAVVQAAIAAVTKPPA